MTTGYGISGIGYPMIGLGNYGLGTTSAYENYDNYMLNGGLGYYGNGSMGMNGSMFNYSGYNPTGMAGASMYGYGGYNPLFMGQMMSAVEQNQLNHAGNMHSLILQNQTKAHTESDRALIDLMLTNASVHKGIENLHTKILEGDQVGICQEFDKLKDQVYKTYGDEIRARGHEENPYEAATQIIKNLYTEIVTAQSGGVPADLETNIRKYGENAFTNGFRQGRRSGHQDKYVDETLQHCLGYRIDEKSSKDKAQAAGVVAGKGVKGLEYGAAGAVGGATVYTLGAKTLDALGESSAARRNVHYTPKFSWKSLGKWGVGIGLATAILTPILGLDDLIWKAS